MIQIEVGEKVPLASVSAPISIFPRRPRWATNRRMEERNVDKFAHSNKGSSAGSGGPGRDVSQSLLQRRAAKVVRQQLPLAPANGGRAKAKSKARPNSLALNDTWLPDNSKTRTSSENEKASASNWVRRDVSGWLPGPSQSWKFYQLLYECILKLCAYIRNFLVTAGRNERLLSSVDFEWKIK